MGGRDKTTLLESSNTKKPFRFLFLNQERFGAKNQQKVRKRELERRYNPPFFVKKINKK